jgi:Domain of unknown function (DUF6891)
MKKTDRDVAAEYVRKHVWGGFYDQEEIIDILTEDVFPDVELDAAWLRQQVQREIRNKKAQAATWDEVTDCDRLDHTFDYLESQGIIALQNAGYTQSDGISDVSEAYHEAGGEKSDVVGYCFYHGQDLERVVKTGQLYLTYGAIDGDDDRGTEIGRRIKEALEEQGFSVRWSGSIRDRLEINGIKWQRR